MESAADFNFYGTAEDFLDLIISNLNRVYGASVWSKGTCKATNAKKLFSSGENCLTMIGRLAKEFEGEFYVSGADDRTINFVDAQGEDTGITLQYKSGIFNIERRTVDPENLVTRLYAYGGERNIPSDYRSRAGRLMFESAGLNYIESNTATYGIIESTKIFDDIFPHRDGTISGVNGSDVTKFTDSGIDFNINSYLLPGITAKVSFKTGNLAGYEFEVSAYNNSTKEITIIEFTDGDGITLPNSTLKPAVSDEYVFLDIEMPAAYVTAAEAELLAAAQAYLGDSDTPKVEYGIEVDDHYLKTNSLTFDIGDQFAVVDTDMGINAAYRIVEMEQSICYPYQYKFKLATTVRAQGLIERVYEATKDSAREIELRKKNYITLFQLQNKIFITEDSIALRVEKNDVINQINVSTEGIKIAGSKITISGDTTIDGTFTLNGSAIINGTMAIGKLNFVPLSSSGLTGAVIATINASAEGIDIDADNISISGSTTFDSGYNPTTKVAALAGSYNSAASGARVRIFPDANTGIQIIDDGGADVFKVLVGGTDVGDVIIGDSTGQYLMFDKSLEKIVAHVDEFKCMASDTYALISVDGSASHFSLRNDSVVFPIASIYATITGTSRIGGFVCFHEKTDSPFYWDEVRISSYQDWGDGTAVPGMSFLKDDTGNYANISVRASDLLTLVSAGDILIDPAGGDVDFDACNICVDAGKKVMLEGVAGDTYMVFNSGAAQIDFYINGSLAGHINLATGFVDD